MWIWPEVEGEGSVEGWRVKARETAWRKDSLE